MLRDNENDNFKAHTQLCIPRSLLFAGSSGWSTTRTTVGKCDSRDHFAVNCNVKRCYNCRENGHINVDCPRESQCQGCGSTEPHIVQCDTSWVVEKEEENCRPHLEQEGKSPPATDSPSMQEDTPSPRPSEEPPAPVDEAVVVFPDPPLGWANSQPNVTVAPTTNEVTIPDSLPAETAEPPSYNNDYPTTTDSAETNANKRNIIMKPWYENLSFASPESPNKTNSPSLFSFSPPSSSVEAGGPAASKRSFQDDSVSDISANRRPSTKKQKGRAVRQPPTS